MRFLFILAGLCVISLNVVGQIKSLEAEYQLRNDSLCLLVHNNLYLPVYIQTEQIAPTDSFLFDYKTEDVLPAATANNIAIVLKGISEKDTANFSFGDYFKLNFEVGDPFNAQHNPRYRYALPFARGASCEIIQGFNGSYSHSRPSSKYAIDFKLKIGDTVYAAREGIVGKMVEHFTEGGKDRDKYYGKDNHIAILHEDGSIAYYVHLNENGVLVDLGEKVEKGQAIGISGNTGWSTRPHLHFVVREPKKEGPIAVKIDFENVKGKKLKRGKIVINN